MQHKNASLSEYSFLYDTLFVFQTGKSIKLADTLALRSRNLLVFWSPTCSYCKRFFLNQLNNQIVGVYCFPLTDDWDYLKYYIDSHQIIYPQITQSDNEEIRSLDYPDITAVPTFIVVDSVGKQIAYFVGINEMNELIDVLYSIKTIKPDEPNGI